MDKLIGSILLIAGTSIGAGMITLPVVIGIYGLIPSILILTSVCIINIFIAFILLESLLKFKSNANLITVTELTLGRNSKIIAWFCCLLFFYSILTAYASGLQELLNYLIKEKYGAIIPEWCTSLFIVGCISSLVFMGTRFSEYINRFLILSLGISFLLLILFIGNFINIENYNLIYKLPLPALPIVYTSFGYLVVIPYIRTYLNSDVKQIKLAIVFGSLITLMVYIIWIVMVIGIIPVSGENSLTSILANGDPGTGIIEVITNSTKNYTLALIFKVFIFLSIASSFIGVALGLYSFLDDGIKINVLSNSRLKTTIIAFFPLLLFTIFFKKIIILALGYAALFSVIISGVYPALMAWSGRSKYPNINIENKGGYLLLVLILMFSFLVMWIEIGTIFNF